MLDLKELREIAQLRDDKACFVSLYLDVDPLSNPKGDYAIQFKNLLKKTAEQLDRDVYKIVREDMGKIEKYVLGNRRDFRKGLVLLSSTHCSFWREYNLAVPVKSELVVDRFPYLQPLFDVMDSHPRYVVLLVDRENARIFTVRIGEITEYGEVHTEDVPGRHKKGGWFALSQNHYERHIDYHVWLHLKDVLKKLDSFLAGEQTEGLIIGGSEEAVNLTRGMLSAAVEGKVIGTFPAEMTEKTDEVLARVETVTVAAGKKRRDETVERLVAQAGKKEQAVLGIADVLQALHEGKVMRLITLRGFQASGFACRSCGALALDAAEGCPFCKGSVEKTVHLADLVSQRAVEQGATVEVVAESGQLREAGGVGAFLRF